MPYPIACCTWALAGPDDAILTRIAELGFEWIDIRPADFAAGNSLKRIVQLGLGVSCMGISFGLPADCALDYENESQRTQAVDAARQSIARAAELGCTAAYVVPGSDTHTAALSRYAKSLSTLADEAAAYKIRLCIEHFPGRALPTAAATLDFLDMVGHTNLYLLYDIGHIQMAGEDIASVIRTAGSRLGYVHLDDNDGVNDLHLSLYDGILTESNLIDMLQALPDAGYTGPLSLELSPKLADPAQSLQESHSAVRTALAALQTKPS